MSQHMFTFDDGAMSGASWMLGSPIGAVLWGVLVVIGIAGWIALARSSLVQGDHMERSDRVPQLYGYSVCLIAIVVMLANVSTIVNTAFTLSDPLAGNGMYGWNGVVLSSFESYRATMDRAQFPMPGAAAPTPAPRPSDAELRATYAALRTDQIARVRLEARRQITSSVLLLLLALALFSWHWRWVRRPAVA